MNHIKEFREKKKLSQKELAEILKIKQQTISDWEREYRLPSLRKAIQMAEILGTTVERLYK